MDKRAAIFAALAQGLDLPGVQARFGLTPEDLQDLFREAAALYRDRGEGFWRLHCDGASRGNPGPAGAGMVLFDPQGRLQANKGRYLGETTNNVAEYQALLLGLEEGTPAGSQEAPGPGRFRTHGEADQRPVPGESPPPHPFGAKLNALKQFEAWEINHVPREENVDG